MHRYARFFWATLIAGFLCLFLITKNDPFFGDAISALSRASVNIYESDFSKLSFPKNLDPGHPVTIPAAHAALWKIFGKQLWVSHLFNLIIGFLILLLFNKWAKKLGYTEYRFWGIALLSITPLFAAQIVNPNLHLPLTLFTLGYAYALEYGKRWQQILFASAVLLTHLQGLYYLTPIWIWWFFKNNEIAISARLLNSVKIFAIPFMLFVGWLVYHNFITGWYLSSPDYAGHRGFPGVKRFIINLIMADWRIVDYGQIGLWIIPAIAIFRKKLKWSWNHPFTLFIITFLFNAFTIGFTTKTGPMHRYLLPCLPFLVLANVAWLQHFKPKTIGIVVVVLFSGHFWFYPGKVMGDATLAYRSVFPLMKEAKRDFNDVPFFSYAPLGNPGTVTTLTEKTDDYVSLYRTDFKDAPYILFSNISGDFTPRELDVIKTWPSKTYQKGYVFVEIYSNPTKVSNPVIGPCRQPTAFEKWFINLKHTIKGTDGV